jgi:2-polyprenyl-3-methyl-5-hydroxy-6-metoxy-1,4-benzoquinol methylase
MYVNPRIDAEARAVFYSFSTEVEQTLVEAWFIDNADLQRPLWQRFLRVLRQYCPTSKLLDIGCGGGSFLVEARRSGYEVVGLDVSDFFVNHCRQKQRLAVHHGSLEDLELPAESFDVLTSFDVVEHHPDPKNLLRHTRRLLRLGGYIIISTHEIGNVFARLYKTKWRYLNPTGHITFFTRETLSKMLTETGFCVVKVGGIHTIDISQGAEWKNYLTHFGRLIMLRSLVLWIYQPLTARFPALTHWQLKIRGGVLNHEKLLRRAGKQIAMNDDVVIVAQAI